VVANIGRLVRSSVRYKLLLLAVLPVLIVAPVTLGLAVYWNRQFVFEQLLQRVSSDLAVARDAFERLQQSYLDQLQSLANSHALLSAFATDDALRLRNQLGAVVDTTSFGFLRLTDLHGRLLLRSAQGAVGSTKSSPLRRKAAVWGLPSVGVELFTQAELAQESGVLAQRARLSLDESDPDESGRALIIRAICPVRDLNGGIVALLDGGVMLNRNFSFVDRLRDLVFGPGSLADGSYGVATVLLEDIRVTTNVPIREGERALGTRVAGAVRRAVLEQGNTWTDRTLVANEWYIAGYEPIVDSYGERVGMISVGYLEAPYRVGFYRAVVVLLATLLVVTGLGAVLAIWRARSIFQPVEAMTRVVRAIQAGEESRIGQVATRDELGELAHQFDHMLDALQRRKNEIRRAAETLEHKVAVRTGELQEKNQRLQETINLLRRTQDKLVAAEKLAALGELTAGVAHEINNPSAVILGNIEVLRDELGTAIEPVRTEIELIIEQVYRIRAIVDNLLRYSRPVQHPVPAAAIAVRSVLEDTLLLVRHEAKQKGVVISKAFAESNLVQVNRQELQQVLVNLLLNAIQAVSEGGRVDLATRDWGSGGVVIEVDDNGKGIPENQLQRVFDPFFTRDKEQGTGLGLSVSYALVRRAGGEITVSSWEGKGTRFELFLPSESTVGDSEVATTTDAAERG
jgi:two-component system NtrC family sensor kinase